MEYLKICQQYFNRYINVFELQEALKSLDLKALSEDDQVSFSALIISIEEILKETNEDQDELVKEELKHLEASIAQLEKLQNDKMPKELVQHLEKLRESRTAKRDNFERWTKISDAIKENVLFRKTLDSLSNLELLELISEDMSAARPIPIEEDKFKELIKTGIENDKREWLWRLAFNYDKKSYNAQAIADYYLDKNDCYYITELISIIGDHLDIEDILKKVEQKDKEFIQEFIDSKRVIDSYVSDEQLAKLEEKLK